MDVYQNGVLLVPATDYAASTGTSVVLVQGASVDDTVELLVFDIFSVADSVSAKDGGSFAGNVGMGGTLSVTGNTTVGGTLGVTGVLTAGAGSIGKGPAFHAHPTDAQTPDASTSTKVTLGTEVFDSDGKFASSRFTPTVAGYYQINASLAYANANYTLRGITLSIFKNGAVHSAIDASVGGFEARHGVSHSTLLYLDADDYVEMYVYGPNQAIAHNEKSTSFSGGMVRKA
jgi:hypothetical protein